MLFDDSSRVWAVFFAQKVSIQISWIDRYLSTPNWMESSLQLMPRHFATHKLGTSPSPAALMMHFLSFFLSLGWLVCTVVKLGWNAYASRSLLLLHEEERFNLCPRLTRIISPLSLSGSSFPREPVTLVLCPNWYCFPPSFSTVSQLTLLPLSEKQPEAFFVTNQSPESPAL